MERKEDISGGEFWKWRCGSTRVVGSVRFRAHCPSSGRFGVPWERKLFSAELLTYRVEIASNAITLKIGGAEWETSCRIFALPSDNCAAHRHLPSLQCFPSRWESALRQLFSAWSMGYWLILIRTGMRTGWCMWNCAKRMTGDRSWL